MGNASADKVARVISAFLNGSGGRLLLGVDESGRVIGADDELETSWFRQHVEEMISPEPKFSVLARAAARKTIVLIDVPAGSERPYVVDDLIHVWRGGRLETASAKEISDMIVTRSGESPRWERQLALGVTLNDLDGHQIEITRLEAMERHVRPNKKLAKVASFLEEINVCQSGQVLNSALVLFADSQHSLPQSRVRIARFNSLDRSEFFENRLLEGNIFDLFDQITAFFERNIPTFSDFEMWERKDSRSIPPFVIREAVMNALVHRDYAQTAANTTVALHPDRLEVWNPGQLPDGVSPETLAQTRVSRPHNPDIANVVFLRGLVEQWGSGTGRIVTECKRAGLKPPEWESVSNGVLLRVFLARGTQERHQLNERMKNYLLNSYPSQNITLDEYQHLWAHGVAERTARRDLEDLEELGYLEVKNSRPLVYARTDKFENL